MNEDERGESAGDTSFVRGSASTRAPWLQFPAVRMENEGARVVDHGPERTRTGLSDAVKFGEVVGVKSGKGTTTLGPVMSFGLRRCIPDSSRRTSANCFAASQRCKIIFGVTVLIYSSERAVYR